MFSLIHIIFAVENEDYVFPLSNCINAGIIDIGIVTKANYQSLMEHIDNGSEWDLARKRGGLKILPPYGNKNFGVYHGKLEALGAALEFIKRIPCKYILLSDCDLVANIDYSALINEHIKKGADVSVIYKNDILDKEMASNSVIFNFDDDNILKEVMINPSIEGCMNFSLNIFIFERNFLQNLIINSICKGEYKLDRDFLQKKCKEHKIRGIEYKGYVYPICSLKSYYKANMDLLKYEVREKLFNFDRPIYTKVSDEAPVKYGVNSKISDSFIADGCIIDGRVEHSIIFRGCKVSSGTFVKNSILMQRTSVGENCDLQYVISDKNVRIQSGRTLISNEQYPTYISKNTNI